MGTTPLGGITQTFTNQTGAASVQWTIVRKTDADPTAVELATSTDIDPVGVMYSSGVANGGSVEVVTSGPAYVFLETNCPCAMGQRVGVSPNEPGYGVYDATPAWVGQAAESVPKPGAGNRYAVLINVEPATEAASTSDEVVFTEDGGIAIYMVNGTGAPSVKGMVVQQDDPDTNTYIAAAANTSETLIGLQGFACGIVAESGVAANSPCLVTVAGRAYVNIVSTVYIGQVVSAHDETDGAAGCGRYSQTNPLHAQVIGVCLSDVVSSGLYLCLIQFGHTLNLLISAQQ
jgi:hypothetical protein